MALNQRLISWEQCSTVVKGVNFLYYVMKKQLHFVCASAVWLIPRYFCYKKLPEMLMLGMQQIGDIL